MRTSMMSREERRENQTYWKAKIGYNMRWVAEGCFRYSSAYIMDPNYDRIGIGAAIGGGTVYATQNFC